MIKPAQKGFMEVFLVILVALITFFILFLLIPPPEFPHSLDKVLGKSSKNFESDDFATPSPFF